MADRPSTSARFIETHEYYVVVHNAEDLESIYSELETENQTPKGLELTRAIECVERRPLSRGTLYRLTQWEANQLKTDPRVKSVEIHAGLLGAKPGLFVDEELTNSTQQTSTAWDKSGSTGVTMKNWGLLRCWEGSQRAGWGGTGYQGDGTGATPAITGTIRLTQIGRNVDCVIVDENGLVWNHPEYAVNADGTGGSRSVQYNWNQHDPAVKGIAASNYVYGTGGHSTHVSGTVAGNTQGWARGANIYNIYYDAGNTGGSYYFGYVFDYVRQFHANKSVNAATGRKNPTICNNSWGMSIFPGEWSFNDITAVTYQGTRHVPAGGITTFNGFSGVCTASTRLATLVNFENNGNRITTTGTADQGEGSIVSNPSSWTKDSNYHASIAGVSQPAASYTIVINTDTVDAGVRIQSDVSAGGSSGTTTLTTSITVTRQSDSTVVNTFTVGPRSDSTANTTNVIDETITLASKGNYSVVFATTIDNSEVTSPVYAFDMDILIDNDPAITDTATVTTLSNSLLGSASLTSSTTPTVGNNDDGYWTLSLPFNVKFFGTNYNQINVGTNHFVTFGGGSSNYSNLGPSNPGFPKIMWCSDDNSVQRIYYGTEGSAPNRTYRVRVEGNANSTGTLGSPGMVNEWVFYEATPEQIDLQLGANNRKTVSGSTFTTAQLNAWGFISGQRIPARVSIMDEDIEDMIDEGIITVGAAGNGRWKHDVPGGADWNNTFEMANRYPASVANPYYYMRGTSPTANDAAGDGSSTGTYDIPNICVGAVDTVELDKKVLFSDCGPGVDIWAPGTYIISSYTGGVSDPRGNGLVGKISGTSMASPQVCGVLACALETYPEMNQERAKSYITAIAKADQLTATSGGPTDGRDIQGAPNLFLFYKPERPYDGNVYPKINYKLRPTSGAVWPRPRIKRTLN